MRNYYKWRVSKSRPLWLSRSSRPPSFGRWNSCSTPVRSAELVYVTMLTFLKEKGAVLLAVGICGMSARSWCFLGTGLAATSKPFPASRQTCHSLSNGGRYTFVPHRSRGRQAGSAPPVLILPYRPEPEQPLWKDCHAWYQPNSSEFCLLRLWCQNQLCLTVREMLARFWCLTVHVMLPSYYLDLYVY